MGKGRPRFMRTKGGNVRTYTPGNTKSYEALVRQCWRDGGFEPYPEGLPLAVTILAYFRIPSSTTKKERVLRARGIHRPTVMPDADNIAKCILDACNGVAYHDDRQISSLSVEKYYAPDEPCVQVTVSPIRAAE